MALVIRPKSEYDKNYLDSISKLCKKRGIEYNVLEEDVSIKTEEKNGERYEVDLKKGDYVLFYGNKFEFDMVMEIGKRLEKRGYTTITIGPIKIIYLHNFKEIIEKLRKS